MSVETSRKPQLELEQFFKALAMGVVIVCYRNMYKIPGVSIFDLTH